jgi:hypothetical protein
MSAGTPWRSTDHARGRGSRFGPVRRADVGMRLLADIRDVFAGEEHLPTSDLLQALHALEDSLWGDWYGSPLSARGLAKLLAPYGVGPAQRRMRTSPSSRVHAKNAWHPRYRLWAVAGARVLNRSATNARRAPGGCQRRSPACRSSRGR